MSAESRERESLRRKDTWRDLWDETSPYVRMSPERRDRLIQHTARLAAQLIRDSGRGPAPIEPLPEGSVRVWRRLREEYLRDRSNR